MANGPDIDKVLMELGEHWDTVQIFCTRHEAGEHAGTVHRAQGIGNYYARYGQVKQWVDLQDEGTRREFEES